MYGYEAHKIRSELPSLHIQHPVTKAMFAHRDALSCDDPDYKLYGKAEEIKGLEDLEKRRTDLILYMKSLGLPEANSSEDVSIVRQRILDYWGTRPDADSFQDLVVMRNHLDTAKQLADHANWYFATMKSADELGYGNIPVSSLSREDYSEINKVMYSRNNVSDIPHGLNQRSAKLRLRHQIHDKPIVEEEKETKWGKLSEDYAKDKEATALSELFDLLVDETMAKFGIDIVTAKPAILTPEVKTLVDAQRYSRPIPPELAILFPPNVIYRSDVAAMPDHSTNAFYKHPDLLESKARLILRGLNISSKLPRRPSEKDLVVLQKQLYPILMDALNKGIEPLHPDVEWHLIHIAAVSLTEGDSYAAQNVGYNEFERHTVQKPLAEYIPALRKLAFQRGIDISPLMNAVEMWRRKYPIDIDMLSLAIEKSSVLIGQIIDEERISRPDHLLPGQWEFIVARQRRELPVKMFEAIRDTGINDTWNRYIQQILLNRGLITDKGYYFSTEENLELRSGYVLEDIQNQLKEKSTKEATH